MCFCFTGKVCSDNKNNDTILLFFIVNNWNEKITCLSFLWTSVEYWSKRLVEEQCKSKINHFQIVSKLYVWKISRTIRWDTMQKNFVSLVRVILWVQRLRKTDFHLSQNMIFGLALFFDSPIRFKPNLRVRLVVHDLNQNALLRVTLVINFYLLSIIVSIYTYETY